MRYTRGGVCATKTTKSKEAVHGVTRAWGVEEHTKSEGVGAADTHPHRYQDIEVAHRVSCHHIEAIPQNARCHCAGARTTAASGNNTYSRAEAGS